MDSTVDLGLAWDGDVLVATSDFATKTIDRPYLSPSTASSLEGCPARFAADRVLPRSSSPFGAAELGTSAHSVLEELYALPAAERTRGKARELLTIEAASTEGISPTPEEPALHHLWLAAAWRRIRGLWQIERPERVMVRQREWEIAGIEIEGVPFRGFIDRSDIVGDEVSVGCGIADYKTGKPSWVAPWGDHQGDQLRLYALAVEAVDGRRPLHARLLFTAHGKERYVSLAASEIDDTKRRWVESWELLSKLTATGEFEAVESKLCPWCPLVTTCPKALASGVAPHATNTSVVEVPTIRSNAAPPTAGSTSAADHITDTPMPEEAPAMPEAKPWEATEADGSLNLNSYSATAVFGLTAMAVDELAKADMPIASGTVSALAGTFLSIVQTVQSDLAGSASLQEGANTRLRGALHTAIETLPLPWGGTPDEWAEWTAQATRRVRGIASVAVSLWADGPGDEPWLALGVEPDIDAEAA